MVAKPALKQSAKPLEKLRLNDSKAIVVGGGGGVMNSQHDVVEISSGEEQEDNSEDDKTSDNEENEAADVSMGDAGEDADANGPTFGDLVRAAEPIDVAGAFGHSNAIEKTNGNQNMQTRSGASLGIVLTQALKTNDASLLETCLQEVNLQTVRLTLQRLPSSLAATLLHHLASRLHRRPGRAGSLIVWVQWTLVTHGGYLASQPGLTKELADMHRVVDQRSRALPSLLLLKGKLDMLEAQMKLRKSMANQRRHIEDEEDEEAVIYVEGQDSDSESGVETGKSKSTNGRLDFSDRSSEISEDMPKTNGVIVDSDDEEEEEDSDNGDLVDDEAEVTDADSGDEDEIDFDDQDEADEEEDSEDEKDVAPPSKVQKLGGLFSRKR